MAQAVMTFKVRDGHPVLVDIRGKVTSCRKLLDYVVWAPSAEGDEWRWSGLCRVSLCQRHGDSEAWGDIQAWRERQRRAGKPTDRIQTHTRIPWADLRPAVEKARRTGKTQSYEI
jgi:hypothetical protein